jgi:hypothetical protein
MGALVMVSTAAILFFGIFPSALMQLAIDSIPF